MVLLKMPFQSFTSAWIDFVVHTILSKCLPRVSITIFIFAYFKNKKNSISEEREMKS